MIVRVGSMEWLVTHDDGSALQQGGLRGKTLKKENESTCCRQYSTWRENRFSPVTFSLVPSPPGAVKLF